MIVVVLTAVTLIAFAANSLLCRMALGGHLIDPVSFTTIRLVSGALALITISRVFAESKMPQKIKGSWGSGFALFAYAAAFSLAYVSLSTGIGALILSAPMAVIASVVAFSSAHLDTPGILLALISGVVTSGLGYVLWYKTLRSLTTTQASVVQLVVPVLAAFGGVAFLSEQVSARLIVASTMILGGVALAVVKRRPMVSPNSGVSLTTEPNRATND